MRLVPVSAVGLGGSRPAASPTAVSRELSVTRARAMRGAVA